MTSVRGVAPTELEGAYTAPARRATPASPAAPLPARGGTPTRWYESTAAVLLVAALVRALELVLVEGDLHDGTSRILRAMDWLQNGTPIFGREMWPEGNFVLPALVLRVWNEPYWAIRIAFALVGLTNVWLAMRVARTVFDRGAAAVTGWVVALMPYHVFVSANAAMSELPYITCMLVALLAVIAWRDRPRATLAAAAGLALTLAATFRVDGVIWGVPLALSFVLARAPHRPVTLDGRTVRDALVFGACGLLYPVALFAQWRYVHGDPWFILDQAKLNTLQFFAHGVHPRWPAWLYQSYTVLYWPASTFVLLTPGVAALAWLGVARAGARTRRAVPLLLGIATVCAWLGYASHRHTILTQWRYAMLLAVVLAAFVAPGARAVTARLRGATPMALVGACVALGLALQGFIAHVTFTDRGVLTRQLGIISPVRPGQFASRAFLAWASAEATPAAPVVLTPHAVESPYFSMHRGPLIGDGTLRPQYIYLPGSPLVYTRAELVRELRAKLAGARWLVTSTSSRQLGLRDGVTRELVHPVPDGASWTWEGLTLVKRQAFGPMQLWEVARP